MSNSSIDNLPEIVTPASPDNFAITQGGVTSRISFANLNAAITGSGEANTASNLGDVTNGLFAQKNGVDLEFKSLIAGANITLTPSGTEIIIASTGGGAFLPLSGGTMTGDITMGTGTAIVFDDWEINNDDNITLSFERVGSGDVEFVTTNSKIELSIGSGIGINVFQEDAATTNSTAIFYQNQISIKPANDATSIVPIAVMNFERNDQTTIQNRPLFRISNDDDPRWTIDQNGIVTQTNDLILGTTSNLQITDGFIDITEISFPSDPAGDVGRIYVRDDGTGTTALFFRDNASVDTNLLEGEANTASNLPGGDIIFAQKVGVDLQFKSLVAGANVSFNVEPDTITINSTAGEAGGGDPTIARLLLTSNQFPFTTSTTVVWDTVDDIGTGISDEGSGIFLLTGKIFSITAHLSLFDDTSDDQINFQWESSADLSFTSPANIGTIAKLISQNFSPGVTASNQPFTSAQVDARTVDVYVRLNGTSTGAQTSTGLDFQTTIARIIALETGGGDLTGPTVSTDNAIATWDGSGGNVLQNTGIIIDGASEVSGMVKLTMAGDIDLGANVLEFNNWIIQSPTINRLNLTPQNLDILAQVVIGPDPDDRNISIGGTESASSTIYSTNITSKIVGADTQLEVIIQGDAVSDSGGIIPVISFDASSNGSEYVNRPIFEISNAGSPRWSLSNDTILISTPTITENIIYDSTVERDVIQTGSAVTNLDIPVLSYEVQITPANDDEPGIITALGALGGTLTGYTDGESITLSSITGTGSGATATAVISLGDLVSITLVNGGTGYNVADQLKITGDTSGTDTATVSVIDISVPISIIQFDLERNDSTSITDRHLFSIVNNGSREWTLDHDGTVLQFGNLVMQEHEIQFEDDKHIISQNGNDLEIQSTAAGEVKLIDGSAIYGFGSVSADWNSNDLVAMGVLSFSNIAVKIQQGSNSLELHAGGGALPSVDIFVSDILKYSFQSDTADFKENDFLVGNIELNKADDEDIFIESKFTQATPSADSIIFTQSMFGQNSGSAEKLYAIIDVEQKIISPGNEDGIMEFGVIRNGTLSPGITVDGNLSTLILGAGFTLTFISKTASLEKFVLTTDTDDNLEFDGDTVVRTGRPPSTPLDTDTFFFTAEGTDDVKESTFDTLQFAIIAGHGNNDAVDASDKEFAFFNKGDGGTSAEQFQFQMPATMEIRNLRVTTGTNNRSSPTKVSVNLGGTPSSILEVTFAAGDTGATENVVASETVAQGTTVTLHVDGDSSGNLNILGFSCLLGQRSV